MKLARDLTRKIGNQITRVFTLHALPSRLRSVVALELCGEWLKMVNVSRTATSKSIAALVARKVDRPENLTLILKDLVVQGWIDTNQVHLSIPRNLLTARNLQLPTSDPQELRKMVDLQLTSQTPYTKEEIIADFQTVGASPSGDSTVLLVSTHRSVCHNWIRVLDELGWKPEEFRAGSEAVLANYLGAPEALTDRDTEVVALLDIDWSYTDFLVIRRGRLLFTKTLPIGASKLSEDAAKNVMKSTEEIQRAVDLYDNEGIGPKIARMLIGGAQGEANELIRSFAERQLGIPAFRLPPDRQLPVVPKKKDIPEEASASGGLSFSAVAGLAWNPQSLKLDLTPPEVRMNRLLAQKARAMMFFAGLAVSILATATLLVSQHIDLHRRSLELLEKEVANIKEEAEKLEKLKSKVRQIHRVTRTENSPLDILTTLHKSIPKEVYLKKVTFTAERGQVILQAASKTREAALLFAEGLKKQTIFKQPSIGSITTRAATDQSPEEFDFDITCELRREHES